MEDSSKNESLNYTSEPLLTFHFLEKEKYIRLKPKMIYVIGIMVRSFLRCFRTFYFFIQPQFLIQNPSRKFFILQLKVQGQFKYPQFCSTFSRSIIDAKNAITRERDSHQFSIWRHHFSFVMNSFNAWLDAQQTVSYLHFIFCYTPV